MGTGRRPQEQAQPCLMMGPIRALEGAACELMCGEASLPAPARAEPGPGLQEDRTVSCGRALWAVEGETPMIHSSLNACRNETEVTP